MELIPAIDLIEGKCVRLTQGDYSTRKVYNEDPLEIALQFEDVGVGRLHVVDLDGAKAGKIVNYKVLERLASRTRLTIDFGGGLKSDEDLRIAFDSGAQMVTGGSIAVKNPARFLSLPRHLDGPDEIAIGQDANTFVDHRNQDTVDHETGSFVHADRVLAHRLAEFYYLSVHFGLGQLAFDYFNQLHHRHRIEEMHPNHFARAFGRCGHLGYGQRRGIGSQNGLRLANRIQFLEDFQLDRHVLCNGLDNDIVILAIFIRHRRSDMSLDFRFLGGFHLAFLYQAGQTLINGLQCLVD